MQEKKIQEIGIAADSAQHIALLGKSCNLWYFSIFIIELFIHSESKLRKIKKSNDKVVGKDLIKSMNEFKEIFMQDYLIKDQYNRGNESNDSAIIIETIDKSYLEVR